ncbi:hypothetical protein GX586_15640 [bacterium]|nr:hypothetical protein [bacterium]
MTARSSLLPAPCLLLTAASLFAAEIVWNDTAADFNAGSSWAGGVAPGAADIAVFANTASLANAPTLSANASVGGIRVGAGPVAFGDPASARSLTIGGAGVTSAGGVISVQEGNMTITLGADQTWDLSGDFIASNAINGAVTLNKTGLNALYLVGNAGAITQATNIVLSAGTLIITNAAGAAADRLNDTADITMQGGRLSVQRWPSATTENVGRLILVRNRDDLAVQALVGAAGSSVIRFSGLSRARGSFLTVYPTTSSTSYRFPDASILVSNIIPLAATAPSPSGWLTLDASFNVINLAAAGYTLMSATPETAWNGSMHVWWDAAVAGATVNVTGNRTIGTLRFNQTGSRILDLGGNTLTVENGGVLSGAASAGGHVLQNGYLTAGAACGYELFFTGYNSTLTNDTVITDNAGNPVSLTKTGVKGYVLMQPSTYSGGTYIDQGDLVALVGGACGSGPVYINEGRLFVPANAPAFFTVTNAIVAQHRSSSIGFNGMAALSNSTVTVIDGATLAFEWLEVDSPITGPGAVAPKRTTTFAGDEPNTYSGGTFVVNGNFNDWQLILKKPAGVIAVPGDLVIASASGTRSCYVDLASSEQIADTAIVTIDNVNPTAVNTILRLNGFDETIGGLVSTTAFNTIVESKAGAPSVCTLIISNTVACSYGGVLRDGGSGLLGIVKDGPGTQVLTSPPEYTNTYTGTTTVKAGVLLIDNALSASPVSVFAGGTLGGNGWIGAGVANDGAIAPGASIGTLSASELTMNEGSRYVWEVSPVDGNTADLINVTGTLTLPPGDHSVTIKVVRVGSPGVVNAKPLFTFAALSGNTNALFLDLAGSGLSDATVGLTASEITLSLVPEPAVFGVCLALLAALRRCRRS